MTVSNFSNGAAATKASGDGGGQPWRLVSVVLLFVGLTFFTGSRWPMAWHDEFCFIDPAVNLARENLLVSETVACGSKPSATRLWVVQPPLYPILLAGWMRLFGLSLTGLRSFSYVTSALAILATAWSARRSKALTSDSAAALVAAVLFSGFGLAFSCRSARYDALAMLQCSLVFLATTIPDSRVRWPTLFAVGLSVPWAGMQTPPALAAGFLVAWLIHGRRYFWDGAATGVGIGVGFIALLSWYHWHGVVDDFRAMLAAVLAASPPRVVDRLARTPQFALCDRCVYGLWLATGGCVLWRLWHGSLTRSSPAISGALVAIAVASIQSLFRDVAIYYSWMIAAPLAVGVVGDMWQLGRDRPPRSLLTGLFLLVATSMTGLAGILLVEMREWKTRDYALVEDFVDAHVSPEDVCFADYRCFIPTKRRASRVFCHGETSHAAQAGRMMAIKDIFDAGVPLNALILHESDAEKAAQLLGPAWSRAARLDASPQKPSKGSWCDFLLAGLIRALYPPPLSEDYLSRLPFDRPYNLVLFRKTTVAPVLDARP